MLKDYDCITDYYLGKTNVLVDALSRKSFSSKIYSLKWRLNVSNWSRNMVIIISFLCVTLKAMNARLTLNDDGIILVELKVKHTLLQRV